MRTFKTKILLSWLIVKELSQLNPLTLDFCTLHFDLNYFQY